MPRKRKAPPGATRKQRKNNREKQRRELLNNRFEALTGLLNIDPANKAEKVVILDEAINSIHSLRAENNELKIEQAEVGSFFPA